MNTIKLRPAPAVALSPVDKTEKQKARLKNWKHVRDGDDWRPYPHLTGNVYDHPRLHDGEYIGTSALLWVDFTIGIAETRNTIYILEGPPA